MACLKPDKLISSRSANKLRIIFYSYKVPTSISPFPNLILFVDICAHTKNTRSFSSLWFALIWCFTEVSLVSMSHVVSSSEHMISWPWNFYLNVNLFMVSVYIWLDRLICFDRNCTFELTYLAMPVSTSSFFLFLPLLIRRDMQEVKEELKEERNKRLALQVGGARLDFCVH